MAPKLPLGKIKNLAAESLKVPVSAAGSAIGLAKGAAASATGKATSTVTALAGGVVGGRKGPNPPAPAPLEQQYAAPAAPTAAEHRPISPDEPVNVTEELGLDPAPVAKPKRAPKAPEKPTTSIDAAADPSDVDVTPADVAKTVSDKH